MSVLFSPDGHRILPRTSYLPHHDLRLVDGRILQFLGAAKILPNAFAWAVKDELRVLASLDETQHGKLLHVSMSCRGKDPSWDDIKAVRDVFYPSDIDAMMVLPKKEDYVNLHPHTFHLWQTPVGWDIR